MVIEFRISDLERLPKSERERETEFMKKRFREWELNESDPIRLDDDTLKKIIVQNDRSEEEGARLIVQWGDRLGAIFKATGLSSSQIRNFFGEVRQIEQRGFGEGSQRRRFILLIPKLEYARARDKSLDRFSSTMKSAIRIVADDAQNFRRFVEFFEAILAYHRAYGGK